VAAGGDVGSAERRHSPSAAALALLGQALVLTLLGLWAAVAAVGDKASDRVSDVLLALLSVAVGVGLAFVGRALAAGARWSRAPAIVWELIMLPVGISLDTSAGLMCDWRDGDVW
jgi:hypothetical protein